jgi:tetratricopeptide (TPR) repeat protein
LQPGAVDAATEARFWRAMAATNMLGTRTIPELLEAAQHATAAYRTLHRPRRLFSALRVLGIWRRSSGDHEGAQAAIDEAASLVESDWPAEFRIVVMRSRAWASRRAGDNDTAAVLFGEAIRLAQEAGDWRLEVIDRINACDLLWELGRHEEAARRLGELLESMNERPASDYESVEGTSVQIGVLCESGRIAEAAAATRTALPAMRRMPKFRFEPCALLLWQLGRPEAAARVLGAKAARERSGREPRQTNDERIANATLTALQASLPAETISAQMALGESYGHLDVCALLTEALAAAGASTASPIA